MKTVIRVYSGILLLYCGWRTVDFLLSQLPKNDISLWLSIAFLFATEAGLLLWHEISLNHTSTREQHYISTSGLPRCACPARPSGYPRRARRRIRPAQAAWPQAPARSTRRRSS